MPTVGLLYPGHSAEDDFPALQARVGGDLRLPVVTTSVGEDPHQVDALLDLGGTERLAEGVQLVAMGSHGIVTAAEVGTLRPDRVLAMVTAADHPDAEAILVPDTAMHTLAIIERLEAAVGKPVLTANQVTVWKGLQIAGAVAPLPGLGALFDEAR